MKRLFLPMIGISGMAIILYLVPSPNLLQKLFFSQAVFSQEGHLLRLTLAQDQQYRLFTPLNQIPELMQKVTLLQEDRYFYYHPGFNPFSLIKGLWVTYIFHRRKQGGSTITMQLVRMQLHLITHTLWGKIKQIGYAILLECYYTKRQILEAYLNLVPYGANIQGIGAASLIYFHVKPVQLTFSQMLSLAVVPQNPLERSPELKDHRVLLMARRRLSHRWGKKHIMIPIQKTMLDLPFHAYVRKQLPFLAPHFVDYVLQHDHKQRQIKTTLNASIQQLITALSKSFIARRKKYGINNTAILLLDTHHMAIRAMLGSADYFNSDIHGQVNGTLSNRSPGSTLKPFIYGLAIDKGFITPKSIVFDLPISFADYQPENIDGRFLGPLSADQALILSRNIPALNLDHQLGKQDLYQLLRKIKLPSLASRQHYGLSIALGSAEMSMLKLVQLYAALQNQGWYQPIRYEAIQPEPKGIALFSPEASYITRDMLIRDLSIPISRSGAWIKPRLKIAWKTGTSSGNRDAWAIGMFSHYVLAIWVGNSDSKANQYLVGQQVAEPLLFLLFDGIRYAHPLPPFSHVLQALNLKKVKVCAISGMLPNKYCPKLVNTWFIPGVSPIRRDNIIQKVLIDKNTGQRSCHRGPSTQVKIVEFWPEKVRHFFMISGKLHRLAPPLMPGCKNNVYWGNVMIQSPRNHGIYYLSKRTKLIPLRGTSGEVKERLYWFVDNNFIGRSETGKTLYWSMRSGKHTVMLLTASGDNQVHHINIHDAHWKETHV